MDLDAATFAYDLAAPSGTFIDTGIGGLTLSGGSTHASRARRRPGTEAVVAVTGGDVPTGGSGGTGAPVAPTVGDGDTDGSTDALGSSGATSTARCRASGDRARTYLAAFSRRAAPGFDVYLGSSVDPAGSQSKIVHRTALVDPLRHNFSQ